MESVPTFHGRKDGYEDPMEYLETITFVVEEKYAESAKAGTVKRLVFRSRLREGAYVWYQRLQPATRGDWDLLSEEFATEYKLEPRGAVDPNQFFNQLYNLKQGKKQITQYVQEAEDLYRKCPDALKAYMGNQFVAGIADDGKLDMVQLYLAQEKEITFPLAKAAVIKAYSRIGRPSPFDAAANQPASTKQEVTQGEVNAELLQFFRGLRTAQSQPNYASEFAKQPTRDFAPPPPPPPRSFQKGGFTDVICHNCMAPGHYSNSCPDPQVSFRQKAANRAKVEEMSMDPKLTKMPQQAPAAKAATIQPYQEQISPKGKGPLTTSSGNIGRTPAHLPMTPAILRRGQTIDEWPSSALVVASKPKVHFDLPKENEPSSNGSLAPAYKVQKPQPKSTRQQAQRSAKKIAERVMGPANPERNEDRIEDITEEMEDVEEQRPSQIIRLPLPPAMRPQATVEETEDEDLLTGDQNKEPKGGRPPPVIQIIDPSVPDLPRSSEPQRRVPHTRAVVETYEARPTTRHQYEGPRETAAINMAKDRSRFEISQFLDSPVTMPIWQLLDRSPQIRAQLARAMASSKPTRRGRKVGTVAAIAMGKKPPEVQTEAHAEEEVVCLYILSWVGNHPIKKTLADTGAVVELINPKLVDALNLQIFEMDDEWTLQLADDRLAKVKQYVWLPINVAGIVAVVRAFILGMGDIYDVLLSKRWMRRVRAIEDHGESTLIIQGKDGIRRLVQGTEGRSLDVDLVEGPSVDDWETTLAEEEIARLAEELDGYDYVADQIAEQEKAERQ